ncbi:MAG: hypothetical protein JAY94_04305 [Candidatus Thiodiazotropha endolucinida]|nr:hypothetical protein [Candidatus Thiodiazotropha taylori]MCW4316713.1 hypothetical protein [Candidatus Thiodiazotropha taylori]
MEYVEWEDVSTEVQECLAKRGAPPELFRNIDNLAKCLIEAGLSPRLGRLSYPFGSFIVDDKGKAPPLNNENGSEEKYRKRSQLSLPDGELIPEEFRYAIVPLGLLLKNAVEVFYPDNEFSFAEDRRKGKKSHLHPIKVIRAGDFLGLFETLHHFTGGDPIEYSPWCVVAGARSVRFTLNPVKNFKAKFKNVVHRFGSPKPAALSAINPTTSDWEITKIIAASMEPDWDVQLLIFAADWFHDDLERLDTARKQKAYKERSETIRLLRIELQRYLYELGWLAASPLFTEANVGDFYQEWNKLSYQDSWTANISKQAGGIAFELFEIDRGLRPPMIDVCYAFADENIYDSLAQVAPIEALITVLTDLSIDLKMESRATAFLPHELRNGMTPFHTTYYKEGETAFPMFYKLENGVKGEILDALYMLLSGSGVFGARQIDPESLLWIANERVCVNISGVLNSKNEQEAAERYCAMTISEERAHAMLRRFEKDIKKSDKRFQVFHETINRSLNLSLHMKGSIAFNCIPPKKPI